jgi:hypothetical protein
MLKRRILERIKPYVTSGVAKRAANLLDALRVECWCPSLPVYQNRIYVANGTLFLNGRFSEEKDFCVNRLPVYYMPDAPRPAQRLAFLDSLLEPDDILTLQEYLGYCLIPSTKGQKMLIITGKGGEGKSRIGVVLRALLGQNMNTGSIAKVETNPFARADLEHQLLLVDDDITAIEGNTSAGNDANGGQVQRRTRGRSLVKAYIRPFGEETEDGMNIDKLLEEMTDEQAYRLLVKAQAHAAALPEPDWSAKEGHWARATSAGGVNGAAPEGLVKRCEVTAILGRSGLL